MKETCSNCRFDTKGRVCPIKQRLHEVDPGKKLWALNRSNWGCSLWEPYAHGGGGSALDKLDHSSRILALQQRKPTP